MKTNNSIKQTVIQMEILKIKTIQIILGKTQKIKIFDLKNTFDTFPPQPRIGLFKKIFFKLFSI